MKNWRTTLTGIGLGLIPIAEATLKAINTGQAVNWFQVLTGVGIMVLGYLAKDFNVSGTGH